MYEELEARPCLFQRVGDDLAKQRAEKEFQSVLDHHHVK